ncbi:MAG: nucleoside 2-deoxyribosyltransferase [Weeksellaceae bacterium]
MTNKRHLNLYFTASIAAKEKYQPYYEKIVDHITAQGHHVVADHIMNATEKQVSISSREDRLKFHNQLERWIYSCDGLIAETSFPSISVGYEISMALRVGKPVLILYSEGEPPSLLAQHKDEKVLCERYTNQTLPSILNDYVHYIQSKSDLRFTFFITPQIASYLDDVSKQDKLPKSVYLRKLIEEDMAKRG